MADSSVPRLSPRESAGVVADVLAPLVARGVIVRRPAVENVADRLDADARSVERMERVRDAHGPGPVRLSVPGREMAFVLTAEDVQRVLDGSPEPFALATREKRAALERFQPHGLLSMRRLAQELDVWPMAVYRWFRDKDELVAALADVAAERVAGPRGGRPVARTPAGAAARRPTGARCPRTSRGRTARHQRATAASRRRVERPRAGRAWQALTALVRGYDDSADLRYGLDALLDGLEARMGA